VTLPDVPLPRDTVQVDGVPVAVRGLSRSEVARLSSFAGDFDGAENWVLACGAEVSEDEAKAWRAAVPPDAAGLVIDRICELSGITEGAQKSNGALIRAG
jgi:hypothetical protein